MRARRARVDSASAVVAIAQAAQTKIKPPACVSISDEQMPFWEAVIAEFSRSEWSEHQLQLAACLARDLAMRAAEQLRLADEGTVLKSLRGTPVMNPRCTAIGLLSSSILAQRRSLALHARAQGGEARDVSKRRMAAKGMEANFEGGDGLIARPGLSELKTQGRA